MWRCEVPGGNFESEVRKGMEIPCPKCMEPIHMAAKRCPNCKHDFSDDEVRANIGDRKSTRLNSSHEQISYAVFCLKKKKINKMYSHHK